jgi:DNA-binding response OmpR family regulator
VKTFLKRKGVNKWGETMISTRAREHQEPKETHSQTRLPRVILVVENDATERAALSSALRREGYLVLAVADKTVAVEVAQDNPLSLMIVDATLLQTHGLGLCCQLRSRPENAHVPLLLTVIHEDQMAEIKRQAGEVNDYIRKPLLWEELSACVQTLLRSKKPRERSKPVKVLPRSRTYSSGEEPLLITDDLWIDVPGRKVFRQGKLVEMGSAVLFDLLAYLVEHRGVVFTRETLLTQVWGYESASVTPATLRTVDVHIHWLREVLEEDLGHPQLIRTVRGVGYSFQE